MATARGGAVRRLPPDDELLQMLDVLNWSARKIADTYGVKIQAVYTAAGRAREKAGSSGGGGDVYRRHWPWPHIAAQHLRSGNHFYNMLRLWTAREHRVRELSPAEAGRLDEFMSVVNEEDLVIGYDPESVTGWVFRHRWPEDGDALLVTKLRRDEDG